MLSHMATINMKIFTTLFIAIFVTATGAGFVAPLLPIYAHELGAGGFQIGLIFGAFSLTRTLFVSYFGKLSDRKGRKPFITTGLFLYFLVSLFYAVSESVAALILLRLGQGFASAMVLPVAQAYVGEMIPPNQEGRLMGLFNISLFGGLSAGPVMGGLIKDWFSIQASFMGMGILTLVGFLLCLILLPAERLAKRDATGTLKKPVDYMDLIKIPSVLSIFTFRTCFTTCIGITWAFLPLLAATRMGLSSSAIGLVVMVNVLISGLLQAPMGYAADRFSKRALTLFGGVLALIAMLCLDRAQTFAQLMLINGILGLAGGVSLPSIMAMGVIEGRRFGAMGSIMGLLALGHSIGMLAGPLLGGLLLDFFDFGTIFISGSMVMALGTIIFWRSRQV
ncbi:MAG: MFS transporter [Deltaproteobacteria bacterium]|nr:MFS transporter [Deltaproteobacteria bacterium]